MKSNRIRAVIDTNCLLASIPPRSPHYWLYNAFEQEAFEWVVSNEILTEYAEKLTDRYSSRTAELVLSTLIVAPNTVFAEAYFNWQLIENDPDDNKFVDVAIAAGVDYLVSNDRDFDVLGSLNFPKVKTVILADFQQLFI